MQLLNKGICIVWYLYGCLINMGVMMKVKIKAKYMAKIKKPTEVNEEQELSSIPSYKVYNTENSKIKLYLPIESFEY